MLLLVLQVGSDRFALDARQIVEVLPMVTIGAIPLAADGVAGVIEYRGATIPVIDVTRRLHGTPAQRRLSTRIIIVRYGDTSESLAGLLVDRATETMRRDPGDFTAGDAGGELGAYLGPVTRDPRGLVQWLDPARLMSRGSDTALRSVADGSWTTSPIS